MHINVTIVHLTPNTCQDVMHCRHTVNIKSEIVCDASMQLMPLRVNAAHFHCRCRMRLRALHGECCIRTSQQLCRCSCEHSMKWPPAGARSDGVCCGSEEFGGVRLALCVTCVRIICSRSSLWCISTLPNQHCYVVSFSFTFRLRPIFQFPYRRMKSVTRR